MWFRRIAAPAFGALQGQELEFGEGINIIHGPNESGKSTWHSALTVALCGLRRGRGRSKVREEFKAQYQPWDGEDEWAVRLELMLDDGREIRLDRDLKSNINRILDMGRGGIDVADDLLRDGSPDGAVWLGLDRTTFPITASVPQARIIEIRENPKALREHLARAAATTGAGETAAGALVLLVQYRTEHVGLDRRNSTRPLRKAKQQLKIEESHLAEVRKRHRHYRQLITDWQKIRQETIELQKEKAGLESTIKRRRQERAQLEAQRQDLTAKHEQALAQQSRLEDARARTLSLAENLDRLEKMEARFPDSDPSHHRRPYATAISQTLVRVENLPEPGQTNLDSLEDLQSQLCALEKAQPAHPTPDPHLVQEWTKALRTSPPATPQPSQSTIPERPTPPDAPELGELRSQLCALEKAQSAHPTPDPHLVQEWTKALRAQPPVAPIPPSFPAEVTDQPPAKLTPPTSSGRKGALAVGVVGLAAATGLALVGQPIVGGLVAGVALVVAFIISKQKTSQPAAEQVGQQEPETIEPGQRWSADGRTPAYEVGLANHRSKMEAFTQAVTQARQLLEESGLPLDPDQAVAQAFRQQADRDRREIEIKQLRTQIFESQQAHELAVQNHQKELQAYETAIQIHQTAIQAYESDYSKYESEHRAHQQNIAAAQRRLEEAGLPLDPDQAVTQAFEWQNERKRHASKAQRLREQISERQDFDRRETERRDQAEAAWRELRAQAREELDIKDILDRLLIDEVARRLEDIEDQQVEQVELLEEWGRYQEALGDRSIDHHRLETQRSQKHLEELLIVHHDISERITYLESQLWNLNGLSEAPALNSPPDTDLQSKLEELGARLGRTRNREGEASGRLRQFESPSDTVDIGAAEARLADAQAELERVERLRSTLAVTMDLMEEAKDKAHRILAPDLGKALRDWIPNITNGRYVDTFVDPETLDIRLENREGQYRLAHQISQGTAGQIYLTLRLILAQRLTAGSGKDRCPVLLDDPTVHADTRRKEAILDMLRTASQDHQVIIFSQEEAVARWASRHISPDSLRDKFISLPGPL